MNAPHSPNMKTPTQPANQSPVFGGHNAYTNDPLMNAVTSHLPTSVRHNLAAHGQWAGSADALEMAHLANRETPQLRAYDARGNRLDQVEFHPAYHALMRRSVTQGLHCSIWDEGGDEKGSRNLVRAARFMMSSGVDAGHLCPITMTNASVAALMTTPQLLQEWLPAIRTRQYDPSHRSPGKKSGLTLGMGMTERQGGTDVRSNTTVARKLNDGLWRINGEKWFFSAPMCDAFLILAQSDNVLSCFLIPRILPDGRHNGMQLQRLKDKLGNRSNASSEVHFIDCLGHLVGEEGHGVRAILEMVTLTRLDCAAGSSGLMRAALSEAVFHCRHRTVFGKKLIDQPLMTRVLADLALDSAAATALSLRLARSFDLASVDDDEAAYARLMTPVIKYWVCKTAPSLVYEAMECLGGNGYVEEGNLARLYREAPLNAIWEGSGNVMCLDVMRVLSRGRRLMERVLNRLDRDMHAVAPKATSVLRSAVDMALADPGSARFLTEQLALTAAAAELRRVFPGVVADAFTETRLGGSWRSTYGMLDGRYNARDIVERCFPAG